MNNTVCNGINLNVEQGQMVCLIGASGAGKSTLLRCINLLEPIEDGEIFLDGRRYLFTGSKSTKCTIKNWNGISKF